MSDLPRLMVRAAANPRGAGGAARAILRGWLCRIYFRATGRRFSAGAGLRIQGRLSLRGPGRIIFGDGVVVGDTTRLWTYSPEATIEVGSGCFLNGPHVWCRDRVTIGPRSILGRAEILDTDFHSTHVDRHRPEAPVRTAAVTIGENVWVGARAALLPGSSVGADAVVGYGAICSGRLEGGKIYVGNPARGIKDVARGPIPAPGDGAAP